MKTLYTWIALCICVLGSAQTITNAEYFWDNDPGPGQGIAIDIDSAEELLTSATVSTAGLEEGIHRLLFRTQEQSGHWSHTEQMWVVVEGISVFEIIAAEYWWNNDPGLGNGTAINVSPSDEISAAFTASTSGLGKGIHRLGMRAQDADGHWSHVESIWVVIEDHTPHLVQAIEYFWNEDPGVGNGTPIAIDLSNAWEGEFNVSNNGLPLGYHWLHIRVKDETGHWSHYYREQIKVCENYGAVANYSISLENDQFSFENTSEFAESYSWTVDGAEQSTDDDFTWSPSGAQEVCLISTNACDTTTLCTTIGVPMLISIDPVFVPNDGLQSIDLSGFMLDTLSTVHIERGQELIQASSVTFQNSTLLSADFDFDTETIGFWDVLVTLENEETLTLAEGLELVTAIGVSELQSNELQLYPNPAGNSLFVQFDCDGICDWQYSIYNMSGQLIETSIERKQNVEVRTSSFASGLYMLVAQYEGRYITRQFIVSH